jgi:hypothetical protein
MENYVKIAITNSWFVVPCLAALACGQAPAADEPDEAESVGTVDQPVIAVTGHSGDVGLPGLTTVLFKTNSRGQAVGSSSPDGTSRTLGILYTPSPLRGVAGKTVQLDPGDHPPADPNDPQNPVYQDTAFDVNESGQVILFHQTANGLTQPLLFTPRQRNGSEGVFTKLTPAAPYAVAFGLNNHGYVTGAVGQDYPSQRAYVWRSNPLFRMIGSAQFLPIPASAWSVGMDINDAGQVLGFYLPDGDTQEHAFLWTPKGGFLSRTGTFTDLGEADYRASDSNNSNPTFGRRLNKHGQVAFGAPDPDVGVVMVIWTPDVANGPTGKRYVITVPTYASSPYTINDHAQVTMTLQNDTSFVGALYTPGLPTGTITPLVVGLPPGLNNNGQVAGVGISPDNNTYPFIWTPVSANSPNGVVTFIPVDPDGEAFSISDDGVAVGAVDAFSANATPEATVFYLTAN